MLGFWAGSQHQVFPRAKWGAYKVTQGWRINGGIPKPYRQQLLHLVSQERYHEL